VVVPVVRIVAASTVVRVETFTTGETIMSSIKLVRFVTPETMIYHGRRIMNEVVGAVGIEITDDDGRKVTVAFDGRYDRTDNVNGETREEYMTYIDCPVITDGPDGSTVQSGPVEDVVAVLRAALNALK
jgi:hypothetical protein